MILSPVCRRKRGDKWSVEWRNQEYVLLLKRDELVDLMEWMYEISIYDLYDISKKKSPEVSLLQ